MNGLPLGMMVEVLVVILLATTIGYCILLNQRLKNLRADREELQTMIVDLIEATNLANSAIKELKTAATDADRTLNKRLSEAERFAIELANHVNAGKMVFERIVKITNVARNSQLLNDAADTRNTETALQQLSAHQQRRGAAA
jgi:hypothetical protein